MDSRYQKLKNIIKEGHEPYPYKFDRRHDFSIVLSHKVNDIWDFGATWVYGTGNAITFPQGIYLGLPHNNWYDGIWICSS